MPSMSMTRRGLAALALFAFAAPRIALADAPKPETTTDMAAILKPGSLADLVVGDANAPVTIIEYGSLTCPHCAAFAKDVLPNLKAAYLDNGKAKLIFREFVRNPLDGAAFSAARCLGDDKALAAIDLLFKEQDTWAFAENQPDPLLLALRPTGLSKDKAMACFQDQKLLDGLTGARDRVNKAFNFTGTPTFIIDGKVYGGELSMANFDDILKPLVK